MAVGEMCKHVSWYLKGVWGNAKVQKLMDKTETESDSRSLPNGFAKEMMAREQAKLAGSAV